MAGDEADCEKCPATVNVPGHGDGVPGCYHIAEGVCELVMNAGPQAGGGTVSPTAPCSAPAVPAPTPASETKAYCLPCKWGAECIAAQQCLLEKKLGGTNDKRVQAVADVEWLRRFLNCSVFGPPPSEVQRAHNVVSDLLSALDTSRACTKERDERVQELQARLDQSATHAPSSLEKFAIAILESSREHFAADVDGGEIQDTAEKLGVLVPVDVSGPCGADCTCAEFGDFPQTCYRYSPEVQALRALADSGAVPK
jgi:hypothetical protein